MGRPSSYTPELAAKICELLATGKTLRAICRDNEDLPSETTVRMWAVDDVQGFSSQYARARDQGLDTMADELLDISDTPKEGVKTKSTLLGTEVSTGDMIEHRRLQVDTRKWYLAKLAPKRYSDKLQHEHSGSVDVNHALIEARKRVSGS